MAKVADAWVLGDAAELVDDILGVEQQTNNTSGWKVT
jgi:hypothetical protein